MSQALRRDPALRRKLLVVAVLYFAEGVPYGFINITLSVYFRTQGMPLEQIGFLSILGLAWSLKVLWSPLVDRYGTRAGWMAPAQVVISLCMVAITGFEVSPAPWSFWALIALLCTASATQDLAIDAYTIDLLETRELGVANGVRIGAYRVALIASGGGLVMLSAALGWPATFIGVAVMMAALALTVIIFRPFHQPRPLHLKANPAASQGQLWAAIQGIGRLPQIWAIILFTLLFKVGDAMMGTMISPFWVDQGFSRTEIGLVSGTFGAGATIVGSMIGGLLTSRWGIARGLWVLGAFQALSNLGYWIAALPGMWRYTTYLASIGESFTGGMGSAAFMAFLMSLCDKRFSATHYAFFSFLFGFSRSIAGFLGGLGAAHFGYAHFFFYTFLAALPAFALLPWVLPVVRGLEEGPWAVAKES
ncbi:MAG: MFS transporter [Deltaproteobacteria bacterium]|nr:MFS transporter [Deltaproteobacteria bacterium]MBW1951977.1 MFS transporter [Deltaproteobacteria bacterium]MBW1987238.1 MFS transporter [Deltaproteobacteria bacterium]MBW2134281.1 MFS transporter [Deltaproteobacteria bacterium]